MDNFCYLLQKRHYLHTSPGFSVPTSFVTNPHATFIYYYHPKRTFAPHTYLFVETWSILVWKGQLISTEDFPLTCSFNMAVIHNWLPIQQPADCRCRWTLHQAVQLYVTTLFYYLIPGLPYYHWWFCNKHVVDLALKLSFYILQYYSSSSICYTQIACNTNK